MRNFSRRTAEFKYIIYFLLLIPFFKFNGYSNFKWPLILVLIAVYFNKRATQVKPVKNFRLKWFLSFFFWILITIPFARNTGFVIDFLTDFLFFYLFYLAVADSVNTIENVRAIEKVLLAFIFIEFIFVLGQYSGLDIFNFISEDKRSGNAVSHTTSDRYWGTLNGSLTLSSFIIPIGTYFYIKYKRENKTGLSLMYALLTLVIVLLSGSRFGLISFLLLFTIPYIKSAKALSVFAIITVVTAVVAFYLGADLSNLTVFQRFATANVDDDGRLLLWNAAYQIFVDFPNWLVGTAIGNVNYYMRDLNMLPDTVTRIEENRVAHVESVYITVLISTGVLGFTFFIMEFVTIFKKIAAFYKAANDNNELKNILIPLRYAFSGICLVMLTEPSYLFYQNCTLLLLLFMGLLYSNYVRKNLSFNSDRVTEPLQGL